MKIKTWLKIIMAGCLCILPFAVAAQTIDAQSLPLSKVISLWAYAVGFVSILVGAVIFLFNEKKRWAIGLCAAGMILVLTVPIILNIINHYFA